MFNWFKKKETYDREKFKWYDFDCKHLNNDSINNRELVLILDILLQQNPKALTAYKKILKKINTYK